MSAAVSLVIDQEHGRGVVTEVLHFGSVAEAQQRSAEYGERWAKDGFRQQEGVWVRGAEWRQKVLVVGGVEYAEEDGEDE